VVSLPRFEPYSGPLEAHVAVLKEVFEMTTKNMGPDEESRKDEERMQRRRVRNRTPIVCDPAWRTRIGGPLDS
jgi:hypothetical protein